jgi:schlafen family protein
MASGDAVRMRFNTSSDLDQLIAHRIPESAALEYKSALPLGPKSERLEVLKDLTGMANGGGGTVIYGMDEDRVGDWPVAKEITPLTDYGLPSRLEDIWRSGVHPPLLADPHLIEVDGGYVLTVDVQPSPVGPYMVEAYGERRHHIRVGTSAVPMTEQQVRDAYALAFRARERRPLVWQEHALPMTTPTEHPWIILSALPEEPLNERLDMRTVESRDLLPPPQMATYINNWELGDLTPALESLTRWVDGFYGVDTDQEGARRVVRIHRDGAAAIAIRLIEDGDIIFPVSIARQVNAALLYLGWLWTSFGVAPQVEMAIVLHNAVGKVLSLGGQPDTRLSRPIAGIPGLDPGHIETAEYVLPWTVSRASVRHAILMRLVDRILQAGGEKQAGAPFRRGRLYDRTGTSLNVTVGGPVIIDDAGSGGLGRVHIDGSISSVTTGDIVGWYLDGVLIDLEGNCVAALEMAPGIACPDDFVGSSLERDAEGLAPGLNGTLMPPPTPLEQPNPTGRWSSVDLRSLLKP